MTKSYDFSFIVKPTDSCLLCNLRSGFCPSEILFILNVIMILSRADVGKAVKISIPQPTRQGVRERVQVISSLARRLFHTSFQKFGNFFLVTDSVR